MTAGRPPGGPDRFPGFDVLSQSGRWDAVTTEVVLGRLEPPAPLRFFTAAEQDTAAALFDQLLDQRQQPRVPVLSMVDARLAAGQTDGWRYEDMPEDGAAFRVSLAGLDADAHACAG
nr:gluconate 2-dehydrogenase subunit 3 family protein [Actinomycetota bacterium]